MIHSSFLRCWFISLLVWLVAWSADATELLAPPEIVPISPTSVTVRWRTDVPTGTRFYYGLAPDQLSNRADGELSDVHEVTVQNLQPGATYFFAVATARKRIGTGTLATSSSNASATAPANSSPATKRSGASVSPPVSPPPAPTPASRFSIANLFKRVAPSASTGAPPARETWGHPASLPDHFARHGGDFGARDPEDYARLAWEFGQRAKSEHLPTKIDATGVRRVFDPTTGAFAAYNPDGTTKTFFKPGSPGYFDRQPGPPCFALTMAHVCPACGWPHLHEPPRTTEGGGSYEICPSCGFQPGVTDDDEGLSPAEWRMAWIEQGMPWSSAGIHQPVNWNPGRQLQGRTGGA